MQFTLIPSGRRILIWIVVLGLPFLAFRLWSPGLELRDGRHDKRTNGIWIQHGWLGDDGWFERNQRDKTKFRDPAAAKNLAALFSEHGVRYVFPHLCPCEPDGTLPPVDAAQAERFLDEFRDFQVVPWIGGVLGRQCDLDSPAWRKSFAASAADLLRRHPRLAGVQVNIEPLPDGHAGYLALLDEMRVALPAGKLLSVAAYPPPTRWHPFPDSHWSETYYREVARRTDLVASMMYDTSLKSSKLYQNLMRSWTDEVLAWAAPTPVLLGIPAYEDAGVGYHEPEVENLGNALRGIHAGLAESKVWPANYLGVAVYSEWEMSPEKWRVLREEFEKSP